MLSKCNTNHLQTNANKGHEMVTKIEEETTLICSAIPQTCSVHALH
jgi:hypothetical protein